jgi:radical SAM protein with 4Fe4S-binding SPASM domain
MFLCLVKKKDVSDWLRLLEQEKVPFKYRGKSLKYFSSINVLVGFPRKKVKKFLKNGKDKIYLVESVFTPPSREKLIKAYNLLNIPYIHFWYYPTPRPTIFLFRIDVDYIYLKGLENLFKISKKFGIKGTYFLNISGEEEFDEKIGHLKLKKPTTPEPERKKIMSKILEKGNEIANHGYWHYVFDNIKDNYKNIRKCRYYLKKLFGIKDEGFASPGWDWNKEWNHHLMKKLRKIKPNNLKGVCKKCQHLSFCMGGCRARAFIEYGNFEAPNPLCQSFYNNSLFPKKSLKGKNYFKN